MDNKNIIWGSLIIGISIIICSFLLKDSNLLNSYIPTPPQNSVTIPDKISVAQNDVMILYDAASYLGFDARVMEHAIENNELPGIPCLKLGENYVFSKKLLDNWVQDAIVKKLSFTITSPIN